MEHDRTIYLTCEQTWAIFAAKRKSLFSVVRRNFEGEKIRVILRSYIRCRQIRKTYFVVVLDIYLSWLLIVAWILAIFASMRISRPSQDVPILDVSHWRFQQHEHGKTNNVHNSTQLFGINRSLAAAKAAPIYVTQSGCDRRTCVLSLNRDKRFYFFHSIVSFASVLSTSTAHHGHCTRNLTNLANE